MVHENIWSLVWYALCKAHKETDVKYIKLFNWFFFKSLMHHNAVYGEWGIIISKMFLMIIKRYLVWYCDHWSMKIYFQFKSHFFIYLLTFDWMEDIFWFNCNASFNYDISYDIIDASFEFVLYLYKEWNKTICVVSGTTTNLTLELTRERCKKVYEKKVIHVLFNS